VAALRGGTEPDLLDEVAWGQADDFWQYALYASVAYIRAAASRAGVPVGHVGQELIGLEMHRLNGEALHAELPFPDEVSALVLKSLATRVGVKDTDVTDIWRCLEAAFAAGVAPAVFADGIRAECAGLIRALFASRRGPGMTAVTAGQGITRQAADARSTRVRALIARVLGPG
jgi:hypothetical protein